MPPGSTPLGFEPLPPAVGVGRPLEGTCGELVTATDEDAASYTPRDAALAAENPGTRPISPVDTSPPPPEVTRFVSSGIETTRSENDTPPTLTPSKVEALGWTPPTRAATTLVLVDEWPACLRQDSPAAVAVAILRSARDAAVDDT